MKTKQTFEKTLNSGLHALLWQEGKWFVSRCLEVEIASQGKTKKEALQNLEEALNLYFEEEKIPQPISYSNMELHSLSLKVHYA